MKPARVAPDLARYGSAVLVAALAAGITLLMAPLVDRALFLFLFSAVVFSAWRGGLGPGLLTAALAVAAANYLPIPAHDQLPQEPGDLVAMFAFGVAAVVVSLVAARLTHSNKDLRASIAQAVAARTVAERAVVELAEGEARFRTMADTAPVLIWTSDRRGQRTYFNRSWLEFTGRALAQELAEGWAEDVHPDDLQAYRDAYHSSVSGRKPFTTEYRLRRSDGEYRWVLDTGVPRVTTEGQFAGFIGSCVDITGRKETEQAQQFLLESARLLASSLDINATLVQVTGLIVPRFADYCMVHLRSEDGSLRQVAAAHVDSTKASLLEELSHLPQPDPDGLEGLQAHAWKSGNPVLVPCGPDVAMLRGGDARAERIKRELAPQSCAFIPLVARGTPLGIISMATSVSGRHYHMNYTGLRELLELFGARAALALDNARLYTEVRHAHERELRTSRLESQLVQARLEALRAQLNPHFLFNALNTIAMLVRREANTDALQGIVGLSQLLRQVLDGRGTPEVPLGEELGLIEHYLIVEQLRFRDRLGVSVSVAPEVLDAWVPSLILQPLVENAIRHGVGRRAGKGHIDIVGRRHRGALRLEVRDNGPGFPEGWDPKTSAGIGLSNTRERLRRLYGSAHRFRAGNAPDGGAVVSVTIPFRPGSGTC